jgi:hypothetical protein
MFPPSPEEQAEKFELVLIVWPQLLMWRPPPLTVPVHEWTLLSLYVIVAQLSVGTNIARNPPLSAALQFVPQQRAIVMVGNCRYIAPPSSVEEHEWKVQSVTSIIPPVPDRNQIEDPLPDLKESYHLQLRK